MPSRKLTPIQADEIRLAKGEKTAAALAAEYEVSTNTVNAIWQGLAHRGSGRDRQPKRGWKAEFLSLILRERISSWDAARRLEVTVPAITEACDELRRAGIEIVRHNHGPHGSWIEVTNLRLVAPVEEQTMEQGVRVNPYGPVIAEARLRHGLSQPHAAEALGVKVGTLRSWEQGKRQCPPDVRAVLAEQWGIDRDKLGLDLGECPCCKRPY